VYLINVKDKENGQNFQKLKLFKELFTTNGFKGKNCTNPHTASCVQFSKSRQLIGKKHRNQVGRRKKKRN